MNGLPYYKAYPRDFIEGTIGMPFEIKCAYRVVLDLIYMQGGKLPDDPRYISGNLGCSIRKWKSIREALIEAGKLHVLGDFLVNFRADKELETLRTLRDKQAENASGPRKVKDLEKPRLNHTEPEPEPVKTEANASAKKVRGTRLPDDWHLPRSYGEWAISEGWPEAVIREQADRFRDYWCGLSGQKAVKRDWLATWRNWMRDSAKQSQPSQQKRTQGDDRWNARMEAAAEFSRMDSGQNWDAAGSLLSTGRSGASYQGADDGLDQDFGGPAERGHLRVV